MMKPKSSLIISPNLGCPEITAIEVLNDRGFQMVIATAASEEFDTRAHSMTAMPSFDGAGEAFGLEISAAEKLANEALPAHFEDLGETRLLISTTLRKTLLPDYCFWRVTAKPKVALGDQHLRNTEGAARSTLYELTLAVNGVHVGHVHHSLCLRIGRGVKFVHVTDLHLAARNDLWAAEVRAVIDSSPAAPRQQSFKNFNERFRKFIKWANERADRGELDLVLALGDLVDFSRTGLFDETADDSNWSTFIDMVTGTSAEHERGNRGLRVPVFTTTGNHDWRTYPYSPAFRLDLFGITKKFADELDLWYRNTSVEVGKKLEQVNNALMREGSPLLARSWWGAIANMGARGIWVGAQRLVQRAQAVVVSYGLQMVWALIGATGLFTAIHTAPKSLPVIGSVLNHPWLSAGGLLAILVASLVLPARFYAWLRNTLEGLIAIESDVGAIADYFLRVNPYFNYAFQLENCAFIVLDTGSDCLTAQSFWDDGGKKVRRISIDDNIIGGAPDTMGFYPANEFYPYSQVSWLECAVDCIRDHHKSERIFVGLHSPAANLAPSKRKQAEQILAMRNAPSVLMHQGIKDRYDIRYGTVNHYLSQFFYICLGYRERDLTYVGPRIDAVFSGHAHWNMEFELGKPSNGGAEWSPELRYGWFSRNIEGHCHDTGNRWGPLLLQTAACGPQGAVATEVPPNFRYVTVGAAGEIGHLRPCSLTDPPILGVAAPAAAGAGKSR
jgi:hypothetical protein